MKRPNRGCKPDSDLSFAIAAGFCREFKQSSGKQLPVEVSTLKPAAWSACEESSKRKCFDYLRTSSAPPSTFLLFPEPVHPPMCRYALSRSELARLVSYQVGSLHTRSASLLYCDCTSRRCSCQFGSAPITFTMSMYGQITSSGRFALRFSASSSRKHFGLFRII